MAAPVVVSRCSVFLRNCLLKRVYYCTQPPENGKFDISLLDILVCPLSKETLRYNEKTNELICDKINVAYPIINGIPNLIPTDARLIKESSDSSPQN